MNLESIKADHAIKYPLYYDFCKELVNQINPLLVENDIYMGFPVEFRVKTLESVLNKLERNTLEVKCVEDIIDFAGIRIICLFHNDLNVIESLLADNFVVHKKENTVSRLNDNSFGYESIHFVISPKPEWFRIPTFKKHKNCKVEIQLKTGAQHIWAAASHLLQYKRELDIPFELRRTINRVAALLEIVDLEFERVESERKRYLGKIISGFTEDDSLNIDKLKYILDKNLPSQNKYYDEPYSEMLSELNDLGINSMDKLETLLKKHFPKLKLESDGLVERRQKENPDNLEIGYQHAGFVRRSLREEFGEKAKKYFDKKLNLL
jgi:ppGpp synthetase/RelA/SpoT-type nucleotidyltranferase